MTAPSVGPSRPHPTAIRHQPAPDPGRRPASPLLRDAFITIVTRFGLAFLIFATDIALARLLGPSAKGRFALVLLYSQLAALIVGWGMDQALAVVAGRDRQTARQGMANALVWTAVVGGSAVLVSLWLYGVPGTVRPTGRWRTSSRTCPGRSSHSPRWPSPARCSSRSGYSRCWGANGSSPTASSGSPGAGSCWG